MSDRRLVYACDACDFTLVDPRFVEECAVVPEVMCRCGKRMRSLGMQPGTALASGDKRDAGEGER